MHGAVCREHTHNFQGLEAWDFLGVVRCWGDIKWSDV